MYILTNKTNVVVYITTDATLKSDGIHVGNNLVFSDKTLNIISIDIIPTEVAVQKYCYSLENGFYINPSYNNGTNNTVTEQVNYILSKIDNTVDINTLTLDEMKQYQISKVGAECTNKIYTGTDVTLTDGTVEHFSLTLVDQSDIDKLLNRVKEGMTLVPYHSDTNPCKIYSADDIKKISIAADMTVFYNTTYCNAINTWIRRCETKDEIKAITFESVLPEDLQLAFNEIMQTVNSQLSLIQ